ncbi:MAG: TRAP transporter substrate-binding protein DctP [Lachnospiraceae bacterium]|nr:TRAP transporter substrate-binding protein DctP [Lachnospiraceae bacterium]
MKFKKIASLVLSATMIAALAGCGQTAAPAAQPAEQAEEAAAETAEVVEEAVEEEAAAAEEAVEEVAEEAAATAEAATEEIDYASIPQSVKGDVVTLKFNFVKTSSDPEYGWYAKYFNDIYEATNHEVGYELYPSEALGGSADVLEMAANGEDVVQDCDFSYLATYVPDIAVAMSPYLIQEPEQIVKLWKSEVGQEWEKSLEEKGLHFLDIHYFGTRNLICNKEVHNRADMASLKIRCAATPMWNEVVRVLGGNATNTAWSETYQALSQGVADGAESPYGLLYSSKLYEPCKYIINTNHLVAATTVVMSQATFEKLSPEAQKALDEVATDFAVTQIDRVNKVTEEYKTKLEAEGVTFIDIDKAEFIEAAQDTPNYFPEWSEGLYERVQNAIK